MENREIYSKWVYKLKKQIRQLKEEKEAIDQSCLFWMEEANKYRQKVEHLQRQCEMYKKDKNELYEMYKMESNATCSLTKILERILLKCTKAVEQDLS